MNSQRDKFVMVTGGSGFLGKNLLPELRKHYRVYSPIRGVCNMMSEDDIMNYISYGMEEIPDVIVHLAAAVGGIGANMKHPGEFFYNNMMMGMNVLQAAMKSKVKKVVMIGTVCSYPELTPVPFLEEDLWNGYPEKTNAPYGVAKKALLVMAQAYRQQYGLNTIFLMPSNMYGPHDNFDPESSHVIPALISKLYEAEKSGSDTIRIWGCGTATRDFLYVSDAVDGIIQAIERYDGPLPVNLGTGREVGIYELACKISDFMGGSVNKIEFDTLKPNGQLRRCLDVSLAKELFGFEPKVYINQGLDMTIDWYVRCKKLI